MKTGGIGLDVCSLIDDINISKERLTAEGGWAAWKYRKIGIGEAGFGNDFLGLFREGGTLPRGLNVWTIPANV